MNCTDLFFRDSKFFTLLNLETLTILAYSFRESKCFDLYNLEDLTILD